MDDRGRKIVTAGERDLLRGEGSSEPTVLGEVAAYGSLMRPAAVPSVLATLCRATSRGYRSRSPPSSSSEGAPPSVGSVDDALLEFDFDLADSQDGQPDPTFLQVSNIRCQGASGCPFLAGLTTVFLHPQTPSILSRCSDETQISGSVADL